MLTRTPSTALSALGAGLIGALLLSGCTTGGSDAPNLSSIPATTADASATGADAGSSREATALLASHGLAGTDARTLIEGLDATLVAERSTDFMASIRPDHLVISDDTGEATLELPADEFYVSIAPYVDQTHECFFHSLTTCQGELANEDIDVEVVDSSGTVLVDETMTTFDNGFVGLWLPRDITGTITLELDGRTVTSDIATGADDPTCVTTLQLT